MNKHKSAIATHVVYFIPFLYNIGIRTLASIDPLKPNQEKSFPFINKQPGCKSACHETLMNAERYTVRKEVEVENGITRYWFMASVMLATPPGQCSSSVEQCYPTSTQKELKVSLGHAICHGGEMEMVEGIAQLVKVLKNAMHK